MCIYIYIYISSVAILADSSKPIVTISSKLGVS